MKDKGIIVFDRQNIAALILLEILSLSPVFMILGNLLPPMGLKIHYYAFGISFLAAVYLLAYDPNKKWLFYVTGFYILIQPLLPFWDVKTLVDFFFGPFVVLALSSIALDRIVPTWMLRKYTKRFLFSISIPLIISFLQFIRVLPFTILYAEYVNWTQFMGEWVPRPNGFLYHGSELAVIIYFMGVFALFKPAKIALSGLFIQIILAAMTLYKAIFASTLMLLAFYATFLDKEVFFHFKVIDRKRLYSYMVVGLVALGVVIYSHISTIYSYTGYLFEPTLLTGRGSIWNIYLEGVKDFSFWNHLFGSGMGSAFSIFEKYATPENYYPLSLHPERTITAHTHNSMLSIFINSGWVGLSFIFFVFYTIYKGTKQNFKKKNFGKFFVAIFVLPIFLIGITIPIYTKAIYWVLLGFTIINWSFSEYGMGASSEEGNA